MSIFIVFAFVLMAFAVFAIGFLFGYKSEDNRIFKKNKRLEYSEMQENDKEIKAKKEWKKFLEYDGSAPDESIR